MQNRQTFLTSFLPGEKPMIRFTVFAVVICLLNFVLNNINHRFFLSDFRVYYMAAGNLVSGQGVYFQQFGVGSGFYKYSPLTLLFFVPYTLFGFHIAAILHFVILSFAFWYSFMIIRKILVTNFFTGSIRFEGLLLSLAALCTVIHLVKELYLGNINILLMMLCLLALTNYLHKRYITGSILFGLVILTKPFFLFLVLPLLWRKKWKELAALSIVLLSGLVLPLVFIGFSRSFELHSDWIRSIVSHGQNYPGVHTLYYFLQHNFFHDLQGYVSFLILFAAAVLASWFILSNIHLGKSIIEHEKFSERNFSFEWFLLLALIPDLVKTDSEHFLASAPLIAFIIYSIAVNKYYRLIPLMVILIFFYGGNSTDFLGRELSDLLYYIGCIGVSNLLLILLAFFLYWRCRKELSQIY